MTDKTVTLGRKVPAFALDSTGGRRWKLGDAAAAERSEFRWASSFDYANWDPGHVVVGPRSVVVLVGKRA